jgi:hypothetical protein
MSTKNIAKYQTSIRRLYENKSAGKFIPQIIGITQGEFIEFINKQLLPGMTKENFGKTWGIDHIVPTNLFDQNNLSDLMLCWNYNNVMPMFINDNRKKGASIHFSLEKLMHMPRNEYTTQLKEICELEIKNTWNKYIHPMEI